MVNKPLELESIKFYCIYKTHMFIKNHSDILKHYMVSVKHHNGAEIYIATGKTGDYLEIFFAPKHIL